jgi:MFS family permease
MRRYLALARLPNGARLLSGSLLIAPGQAAVDLVVLLALHRATGSFGPGGIAVAASTIAYSVSAIVQGRLIDRLGIRRVITFAALALTAATAALAGALAVETSPAALIGLSGLLGLTQPATTPALRTAWMSTTTDPNTRVTAFSYSSVTQDAGYVAGPALFGLLATAATPTIALLCCSALTATGTLVISSTAFGPSRTDRAPSSSAASPLLALLSLAATMAAVGAALATVDVSAPAIATQHGQPHLSGVLLAACFLGSLLGGLGYGARAWHWSTTRRLLGCVIMFATLLILPALTPTLGTTAIALLLAGMPMGATLATAYLLAGELLPAGRTTVGFSIFNLALNAGGAAGYGVAGQLAAHHSATEGFLAGAAAATLGAIGAVVLAVASCSDSAPPYGQDRCRSAVSPLRLRSRTERSAGRQRGATIPSGAPRFRR